jgi:hypothetical protein
MEPVYCTKKAIDKVIQQKETRLEQVHDFFTFIIVFKFLEIVVTNKESHYHSPAEEETSKK